MGRALSFFFISPAGSGSGHVILGIMELDERMKRALIYGGSFAALWLAGSLVAALVLGISLSSPGIIAGALVAGGIFGVLIYVRPPE